MPFVKRALISVFDKTGIVDFAGKLEKSGVEILSTGGTADVLRKNKIKVIEVSDYTGSPEILDGRLKTLHPKIHGGILGMRGSAKHKKEMAENKIGPIDMVVVNLYPFEAAIAKKGSTLEDAIENIDIGGPAMIRAAAKNWQDVAVVVEPGDYEAILKELAENSGEISKETCFKLAGKVFATTARYETAIADYLLSESENSLSPCEAVAEVGKFPLPLWERVRERGNTSDFNCTPPSSSLPRGEGGLRQQFLGERLELTFNKVQDLRYGENPHQKAAFYKCPHLPENVPCVANCRQIHGKELSYNNIMDADAAIELAREFAGRNAAVIIKHANPCGAAVSEKGVADAFVRARDCDSVSAFGGIVAVTGAVDRETATAIGDTFFEVIIAPEFKADALEILKAKKNLRLLEVPRGGGGAVGNVRHLRKVGGGLLVQDEDAAGTDISKCKIVTKRKPSKEELVALDFAWRVVKHVKSNAIVISSKDGILGVGAGQMSRIDSVKIAVDKSQVTIHDSRVLASDAFFPFRDGIDLAAKSGITAVVQPGGSIRDDEVVKAADESDMAMVFTGIRHFRH